ncbi:TetR/AcrR family transcriptional regulator [Deinococcus maricopensis]|uniref:Regulatory protein TetR n=1 Tax=Deinococcus maricopensis (strain DSM 21211 / LMG 22137 / NRRL B-23946 / LB-34) TaxID=709986 RepID=E8U830_DEIML|nr:TetR/AcrR family transcriptional regulator [Deinococcus maricopensis]ADV67219.1 regulatory protein TetR [Deinococcus maricopensis DSM 21211]
MPRPRVIPDEQLLDAARSVFAEHGYSATTAQIATRARVSEGTLFKRYATKEALFLAAVGVSGTPAWHDLLRDPGTGDAVADRLERACLAAVAYARAVVPQLVALWSRGTASATFNPEAFGDPVSRDLRAFEAYLHGEVQAGRLRAHHTPSVARLLHGALLHHIMLELRAEACAVSATPLDRARIDDATFVRTVVHALIGGLHPAA